MKKILAIDDKQDNLTALKATLSAYLPDILFIEALSAERGIMLARKETPDVILLDAVMPETDGYTACSILKGDENTTFIPIIMITAVKKDMQSKVLGLEAGADAFLFKPFNPVELIATVNVMFRISDSEKLLRQRASQLEKDVKRQTKELMENNRQLQMSEQHLLALTAQLQTEIEEKQRREQQLQEMMSSAIQAIARSEEMRDPYTAGHQNKVSQLSVAIAKHLHLAESEIQCIQAAATLHDIGKIAIPSQILIKPTRLTKAEYNLIKTHSQNGYDILAAFPFPCPIADIVLQHHERIDGSGYPNGLKKDDILLAARIIAVADVVEAMAANRPYRPALGIAKALREIERGEGTVYDTQVARACIDLFEQKLFDFSD